jgi:hypothetical protein
MADDVDVPVIDLTKKRLDAKDKPTGIGSGHDNSTGGYRSDHIEHDSDSNSDEDTDELSSDTAPWMKEALDKIKSLSGKNIVRNQQAHDEKKGRRKRERDLRRSRSGNVLGGHGVRNDDVHKDIHSSDESPPASSEEDSDDEADGDHDDCVIITPGSVRHIRPGRSAAGSAKRKAQKPIVSSSGMDSSNYSTHGMGEDDAKRSGRRMRSQRVNSSESSDDSKGIAPVREKRGTKLTCEFRHRRRKKLKKKKRPKHTKQGRKEERIKQRTHFLEILHAKRTIKTCTDPACACPSSSVDIISGRTFNAAFTGAQRNQWMLDKMTNMPEKWTHFVVERKNTCRLCFEAYFGLKVNS